MKITLLPTKLQGTVAAVPSKSQVHRLLICAAFADRPTTLLCPQSSQDIEATVDCLNALGAEISRQEASYQILPVSSLPEKAVLNCGESGSTLRFLLPVVGALGIDTLFQMNGRLPQRPLSPLWEEMERMGCHLSRPSPDTIQCSGKLRSGNYTIDGGISSQFVTGLLFALSFPEAESTLTLTGKTESLPYIEMTLSVLQTFGISIPRKGDHFSLSPARFRSPGQVCAESDWSNAAFWLAANSLGSNIAISGLNPNSPQGDRIVGECLDSLEQHRIIDAAHIPDLIPVLSVVAGAKAGARFINAGRLRLKETDRLSTTAALIHSIGGKAEIPEDNLVIHPTGYTGGTVDATGDHRIAMAAAIAATVCTEPLTILGAESVEKSYPAFWQDYQSLGGKIL